MARINSKTPLSRLINTRMAEVGISRTDLVKRLGNANPSRGLRRFDEFMETGQVTTHLLNGCLMFWGWTLPKWKPKPPPRASRSLMLKKPLPANGSGLTSWY